MAAPKQVEAPARLDKYSGIIHSLVLALIAAKAMSAVATLDRDRLVEK
jgi:hypothetical protein